MATTNHDVLSTKERIDRIRNIISICQQGERAAKNAEVIAQRMYKNTGYTVWSNIWQYVQNQLDASADLLTDAETMLTELLTASVDDASATYRTNFTYKGKWEVGKGGIDGITIVGGGTNTITCYYEDGTVIADAFNDGGVATNDDGTVIKSGDQIYISGAATAANNGPHTVTACTDSTITVSTSMTGETISGSGYVELVRRSLDT